MVIFAIYLTGFTAYVPHRVGHLVNGGWNRDRTAAVGARRRWYCRAYLDGLSASGGSPLIYLYYVDTGNTVRDIRTTTAAKGVFASSWAPGELWGKNSTLSATANTGLAALAHYCSEGCMNQNVVVFQKQGNVLSADGRDWSKIIHIIAAVAGTSLSLFPSPVLTPDMNIYNYSLKPQARLFFHREGLIIEAIFNDVFEFTWTAGEQYKHKSYPITYQ